MSLLDQKKFFTLGNHVKNTYTVLCEGCNEPIFTKLCRLWVNCLYHEECFEKNVLDDDD